MADLPVTEGQLVADKYRIEQVLGAGGSGFVVAAWNIELERRVALKFLHSFGSENADLAERFRREARAAAKISSEHVARVIDVGMLDSAIPYIVMEHLEGHDLAQEMAQTGQLPVHEAVDFTLQAIEALAEAHSLGIVHRDLKPANLFIASHADGTRLVKVLDFGISKSLGSSDELSLTRTSTLMGSPLYMSPEQMRSSRDVDARTDIWSLGVILYEMLAQRTPFEGESLGDLCAAILSEAPASLCARRHDLPLELEAVVLRCLAKSPAARFATVGELARALAPFGSPSSQLHVDRASRILDSRAPLARAQPSALPVTTIPHANGLRAPALKAIHSGPPTIDSWGRDPPLSERSAAKRTLRRVLWVGLAAGTVGALCTTLFVSQRHPPSPTVATASLGAASPSLAVSSPEAVVTRAVAPEPSASTARLQASLSIAEPRPLGSKSGRVAPRSAGAGAGAKGRSTFKADTSGFGGRH